MNTLQTGTGRTRRALGRMGLAVLGGLLLLIGPTGLAAQTEPPAPLAAREIRFPDHEEFTLENGLRVVVLSYGTQPVMSARMYFPGGSSLQPAEKAGLAGLTAEVLTKGTTTRDAVEISETIEGVGGSLSASSSQDFFTVSTVSLTDDMSTAFELLGDVVRNATFPEEEIELARRQTLSVLQAERGQPQSIASRHFSALVYGEGHPYGVSASPETVQAVTREDMVAFRDRLLRAEGAVLFVAGRVTRDEIERQAREQFADWSGEAAADAAFPIPPEREETRIYLIHRPGSVQSVIRAGHLGVEAGHPDYFSLDVLNRVLGGGADSRLFRILREEKGWTYGAFSSFSRPSERGVFLANAAVRNEVTDSALVEMLNQLERLENERVPDEELDAARNFLAGSFPLRLETADQVAGQIASNLLRGLPMERLTGYPAGVRAVTADEVQRAATDHVHPDRTAIVVVGDGTEILDKLEGIAPIEILDIDGSPISREELAAEAEPAEWDGSRLEPGVRRYRMFVQDNPMGDAEYRLEHEGDEWVSAAEVSSPALSQESRLRFGDADLSPRSVVQEMSQGAVTVTADLRVEDGRLLGTLDAPEEMGGNKEFDEELRPGTLLPGMEEFALAVAELEEGAQLTMPSFNLLEGEPTVLQARVTGEEEVTVEAGAYDTWRVELTGGQLPVTLFLRKEAPHILVRQEFVGQPIRLDLSEVSPL